VIVPDVAFNSIVSSMDLVSYVRHVAFNKIVLSMEIVLYVCVCFGIDMMMFANVPHFYMATNILFEIIEWTVYFLCASH